PDRVARERRRRVQPGTQRRRPDAASGACGRSLRRRRGWAQAVPLGPVVARQATGRDPSRAHRGARALMSRPVTAEVAAEQGLTRDEYARIVDLLGRTPTFEELAVFGVMWSEHCSYKSSRPFLRLLP